MPISRLPCVSLMLLLVQPGTTVADTRLTVEERTAVGDPGAANESVSEYTLWLGNDRAARVGGGVKMVTRLDLGKTYVINEARGSVNVIEMSKLPDAIAGAATVTRTGEMRTIGDWETERYDLSVNTGRMSGTIVLWISDEVDVPLDPYRAFSKSLDGGTGMLSAIADLPGYPVLQETDLGIVRSTVRLVDAAEETAPAGTYDVPQQ